MKKIGLKLILGVFIGVLLIIAAAAGSIYFSRRSLRDSIGSSSVSYARMVLMEMQKSVFLKMELMELIAENPAVLREVAISNKEFAALRDVEQYINKIEEEWNGPEKKRGKSLSEKMLDSGLSLDLRRQLIDFFADKYGSASFDEVFITNRYGAVIAMTEKTSDYRQDEEAWFQAARIDGYHVGEVMLDKDLNSLMLPLSVRIKNEEGEFLGVIRAVVAGDAVFSTAITHTKPYHNAGSVQIRVLTHDGKMVYGKKPYEFHENMRETPLFRSISEDPGYFISGESELISYARSKKYNGFNMPEWILVAEYNTEEVFSPVFELQKEIALGALALVIAAAGLGVCMSLSIFRPAVRFRKGVSSLASSLSQLFTSTRELASDAASAPASITATLPSNVPESDQEEPGHSLTAVEWMSRIGERIEVIARSIVDLGKRSEEIVSISSALSDIAAQTNVLAVNAAIEASKASKASQASRPGEQCGGFGVIAGEIRRIAVQSRETTQQANRVMNDVRETINSAVLAAEDGAKAVNRGIVQSRKAGESMRMIIRNMEQAADAARHLSASV